MMVHNSSDSLILTECEKVFSMWPIKILEALVVIKGMKVLCNLINVNMYKDQNLLELLDFVEEIVGVVMYARVISFV